MSTGNGGGREISLTTPERRRPFFGKIDTEHPTPLVESGAIARFALGVTALPRSYPASLRKTAAIDRLRIFPRPPEGPTPSKLAFVGRGLPGFCTTRRAN